MTEQNPEADGKSPGKLLAEETRTPAPRQKAPIGR
jgi:hypothetical protein